MGCNLYACREGDGDKVTMLLEEALNGDNLLNSIDFAATNDA